MKNPDYYSIKKYTLDDYQEFKEMRKLMPRDFHIRENYKITPYNSVYLLIKKVFFLGERVVGYSVIDDYSSLKKEEVELVAGVLKIPPELFRNHKGLYIEDFVIDRNHRKQGIGSWFFEKIRSDYLNDEPLLLKADDDSDLFWMRQGFDYADEPTKTMKRGY